MTAKKVSFYSKKWAKTAKNCGQVKFFFADNEEVIKKMQKKMGKMTFVLKKNVPLRIGLFRR